MLEDNETLVEELFTPEGNEATERCPICERLNCPGAADHCEHFFCFVWDGEIIWGERHEAFVEAWGKLTDLLYDLWDVQDDPIAECRKLAQSLAIPCDFLKPLEQDEISSAALTHLVDCYCGDEFETDGMLSGTGMTLYLDDFSPLDKVSKQINEFVRVATAAFLSIDERESVH